MTTTITSLQDICERGNDAKMSDTPENPVFDIAIAYQRTAALMAAVKLDIFTIFGSETMALDDLASRASASVPR
jgi:hypothetical protein